MEALSLVSSVTTVVKIANDIKGAVNAASRNKKRCEKLAERVGDIGDLLKELDSSSPSTAAVTRKLVGRLERALRGGLLRVRSCQVSSRIYSLIAGSWQIEQFDEVNAEIDRCLLDLSLASLTLISCIDRKLNDAGDPNTEVGATDARICQTLPPKCSHGHDDDTDQDDDEDKMAGGDAGDVGDGEKNGALVCYDEQNGEYKTGTAAGEVTVGAPAHTVGMHYQLSPPPCYGYHLHYSHCTHDLAGGHCHCAAGGGHYSSSYPWDSDSVDMPYMFSDDNPYSCSVM